MSKGWSAGLEFVPRRSCLSCGVLFYAPPVQMRRGGGQFCSKPCYGRHRREVSATLTCQQCGAAFHRPPAHIRGAVQVCSMACRQALTVSKRQGACSVCGRGYRKSYPAQRYCSMACRPATVKAAPKPLRPCESCGLFYSPSGGSKGRFCSLKCYGRYQGKAEHSAKPYSRMRGGKRADLGGRYFRSAWEANWARYLNWLQSIGEIQCWAYEPDTFEFTKIKRGSRFYTPDFRVTNKDGSIEYHEIKGWMDPRSATKLRRMAKYHPKVKVIVVQQKFYSDVARKVSGMVSGWEHGTVREKALR